MPVYEYFCKNCNDRFELLRSMSLSDQDVPCIKCHTLSKRALSKFYAKSTGIESDSQQGMPSAIGHSSCSSCTSSNCSTCCG